MAYFSGDDVAENKKNSIEGTIDGFSLSGKEDASGWGAKVEASIDGSAVATGTAKGGGAGNGSFTANFHGADTKDVDGTATPIGPKVMVGEFNADFTQRLRCRRVRRAQEVEVRDLSKTPLASGLSPGAQGEPDR